MSDYILMCKTLPELQNRWVPKPGDRYLWHARDTGEGFIEYVSSSLDLNGEEEKHMQEIKKDCTYLPYLDNLIEMAIDHFGVTADLIPYSYLREDRDVGDIYDRECVLDWVSTNVWNKAWNWGMKEWEEL